MTSPNWQQVKHAAPQFGLRLIVELTVVIGFVWGVGLAWADGRYMKVEDKQEIIQQVSLDRLSWEIQKCAALGSTKTAQQDIICLQAQQEYEHQKSQK